MLGRRGRPPAQRPVAADAGPGRAHLAVRARAAGAGQAATPDPAGKRLDLRAVPGRRHARDGIPGRPGCAHGLRPAARYQQFIRQPVQPRRGCLAGHGRPRRRHGGRNPPGRTPGHAAGRHRPPRRYGGRTGLAAVRGGVAPLRPRAHADRMGYRHSRAGGAAGRSGQGARAGRPAGAGGDGDTGDRGNTDGPGSTAGTGNSRGAGNAGSAGSTGSTGSTGDRGSFSGADGRCGNGHCISPPVRVHPASFCRRPVRSGAGACRPVSLPGRAGRAPLRPVSGQPDGHLGQDPGQRLSRDPVTGRRGIFRRLEPGLRPCPPVRQCRPEPLRCRLCRFPGRLPPCGRFALSARHGAARVGLAPGPLRPGRRSRHGPAVGGRAAGAAGRADHDAASGLQPARVAVGHRAVVAGPSARRRARLSGDHGASQLRRRTAAAVEDPAAAAQPGDPCRTDPTGGRRLLRRGFGRGL